MKLKSQRINITQPKVFLALPSQNTKMLELNMQSFKDSLSIFLHLQLSIRRQSFVFCLFFLSLYSFPGALYMLTHSHSLTPAQTTFLGPGIHQIGITEVGF